MRIGFGYDIHPLVDNRPLIIGGIHIPFHKGLQGHSDADVLAHAVADALLGAAGLGDIGEHFPDTDPKYKNYNSMLILKEIERKVHFEKLKIINIAITLVLQKPKIGAFKQQIAKNIAENLLIRQEQINVKATTAEGLGFVGRGEGVICYAIALLNER
jgi:2-C-methyl-D-erythritol 2,4-cyclodiphosphate synthase